MRVIEAGAEVVVTYEATRRDGNRFRNTEVLTFDGDRQVRAEVYFGWTRRDATRGAGAYSGASPSVSS